jgi:hypothetical protein
VTQDAYPNRGRIVHADAVIHSFSGIVHYVEGERVYASRGDAVYASDDGGASWRHLFTLPTSVPLALRSRFRLSRRLLRAGVHHIVPVEGERLVALANGRFHAYDLASGTLEQDVACVRGRRPLALCRTAESMLYYGEYRSNAERSAVHVLASADGGRSWDVAHAFNGVRHVHGVFADAHAGALWVTTGDEDQECGIWMTRDRFASLELVLGGSQRVRAVQVIPTPGFVYFGSDSPSGPNAIYRFSRDGAEAEKLCDVGGPVFYGCQVGEAIFFSTACEPGVESPFVALWGTLDDDAWRLLARFRKDVWPKRLFQYGQVLFPGGGCEPGTLWATPFGTDGDQRSLKLDIERLWEGAGRSDNPGTEVL